LQDGIQSGWIGHADEEARDRLLLNVVDAAMDQPEGIRQCGREIGKERRIAVRPCLINAEHRFAARFLAEPLRDVVRQLRPDGAEKAACGLAAGIGKDRPDGAFLDDAPAVDDCDPVGDTAHHFHLVRDQENGQVELFVDVLEKGQDRMRGLRVERRCGFVRQKQRRPGGERTGDADTLLLAAGERRRIGLCLLR